MELSESDASPGPVSGALEYPNNTSILERLSLTDYDMPRYRSELKNCIIPFQCSGAGRVRSTSHFPLSEGARYGLRVREPRQGHIGPLIDEVHVCSPPSQEERLLALLTEYDSTAAAADPAVLRENTAATTTAGD